MTGREWKPGDVVSYDGTFDGRMFLTRQQSWVDVDGERRSPARGLLRPLVVIDPEDREQVERFDDIYQRVLDAAPGYHSLTDVMQDALLEFVKPTLAEPTGRFAEVVNAEGMTYYRSPAGTWHREKDDLTRPWDQIGAVKVISEGVAS